MKIAHLPLIALLGLPCAAHATSVEDPGPHRVPRDQPACQNLIDADRLNGTYLTHDTLIQRRMWAELGDPENAMREKLCIPLRKGTVVTVEKRTAGYECVQVKGHRANACFYTRNVSGTTTVGKEPVYDGVDPYLFQRHY